MQQTQLWKGNTRPASCQNNEATGPSDSSRGCHSGLTRGGEAAGPGARTVTRATLGGLGQWVPARRPKWRILAGAHRWFPLAFPDSAEKALKGGQGAGQQNGEGHAEINMPACTPPAGRAQGHLGNR